MTTVEIPFIVILKNIREDAIREQQQMEERRKSFCHSLRRRIVSGVINDLAEEAARAGYSEVVITSREIRVAFLKGGNDSMESWKKILDKVILWSEKDPVTWDISFMGYDLDNRCACARDLYDMAFYINTTMAEESATFYDVIMDLVPDYVDAGYTVKLLDSCLGETSFSVSGW